MDQIKKQIQAYISSQSSAKRNDMETLHSLILQIAPAAHLWFLDGKNEENKVVSNPNIGYGKQTMQYAKGRIREFYRVGISANTSGISIYIMGLSDKNFLAQTYGPTLGKASISGYCIKFKSLADINTSVLENALRAALESER